MSQYSLGLGVALIWGRLAMRGLYAGPVGTWAAQYENTPMQNPGAPSLLQLPEIINHIMNQAADNPDYYLGIPGRMPFPSPDAARPPGNPFAQVAPVDPLVLDLGGDGIKTTSIINGTFFDVKGNGFAQLTGWVSPEDGLLVRDINGDGVINDGRELFGDQTILKNGTTAANGFQALADLDDNGDGKIDASDMAYSELRVWQDLNGNGITESGEMFTFDQLGIESLNVSSTTTNTTDSSGNTQILSGSFERQDGTMGQVGDYLFETDTTTTVATNFLDVPEEIVNLPYLQGHGTVYDSWQAMVRDQSGTLKNLMQSFATENDPTVRNSILDQILYKWTNSDGIASGSRGSGIDARQLAVMEQLYGQGYVGVQGANPNPWAAKLLQAKYNNIKNTMRAGLWPKLICRIFSKA